MSQDVKAQAEAKTGDRQERVDAELYERRAQFARSLFPYVAWGAGVLAIGTMVAWLFARQFTQLPVLAIFLVLITVSMGLFPALHRRGLASVGFYLGTVSLTLTCFVGFVLVPDAALAAMCGYAIVVVLSCLLLSRSAGLAMTGVAALLIAGDVFLAQTVTPYWFAPLDQTTGTIVRAFFGVAAFLTVAAVLLRLVLDQESFFRQARLATLEVEARMKAEQEQRERLEQANEEVRQSAAAERQQREALHRILARVREAANALSAQAAEILATTTQQAAGATEQAAAISQATTTVDEIKAIAEQLVSRSRAVADAARRTVEVSRTGQETVRKTISGMAQIKARVDIIEENILALSDRTNQIGEIIGTVSAIAAQSNMLALNASVEAARAGDQGRGFAVVAQEVRALATRSTEATAQVKAILSDIQRATNATGMATEEGKKGVDTGVELVAQMGETIDQLAGVIDQSAQSATQMVGGGQQQTSGMDQIVVAMHNINQVTAQSLSSTRQAEKSAQELNALSGELSLIVEQYQR